MRSAFVDTIPKAIVTPAIREVVDEQVSGRSEETRSEAENIVRSGEWWRSEEQSGARNRAER